MNIIVHCSFLIFLFDLTSTNQDAVTCSSTFKLINQQSGDRLHSHDVKYGSGSGQQVNKLIFFFFSLYFLFGSLLPVHLMRMMSTVIGKFVQRIVNEGK